MRGIAHRLIRALAALLMILAIASPAIAEIGCSWDTATHAIDAGAGNAAVHADDHDPGGDGDNDSVPGPDNHCAFSHGSGGLASAAAPAGPFARRAPVFPPAPVTGFVTATPSGPDRPPRG